MKKAVRAEGGFTLLDLLVAMGVGAIAMITVAGVVGQAAKVRRMENVYTGAMIVRQQIFENLNRYDNFQATIHLGTGANGTKFACLKTHSCALNAMGTGNFDLRLSTGGTYAGGFTSEIFYNASNLNEGFTPDGIRCTSTTPTPNATCPIRADLAWQNICTRVGGCNPGMIKVFVTIKVFQSDPRVLPLRGRVVTTKYGFELVKNVYDLNETWPFP